MNNNTISRDTSFNGRLVLLQPIDGYRFSIDALLLTWFTALGKRAGRCVDLGCGNGVVGLSLLQSTSVQYVIGVEIQSRLAGLAKKNIEENNLQKNMHIIEGDIKNSATVQGEKQFDLVVCNPPFWPGSAGKLPDMQEKRVAKHEIEASLFDFVKTAKRLLHPVKGRFCLIYPARRLNYLMAALNKAGLYASKICFVQPVAGTGARFILVESRCGEDGETVVLPPVTLKDTSGDDSLFIQKILNGEFSEWDQQFLEKC